MHKINSAIISVIFLLLAAPGIASAGSWICEHDNKIREINVERETGSQAPCSVVYDKDSEGQGSAVLWSAVYDGSYCDAKADGLAEKLQGFGWSCSSF